MAVPVGPTVPTTESASAVPVGGFSQWFRNIYNWVTSLSPAGATQYDTDWMTITLTAGYAVNGAIPPQVRRTGKDLELRGLIRPDPAGGFTVNAAHNIAAAGGVPSGFRPLVTTYAPIVGSGAVSTNGARLVINSDGSMQLNVGASTSTYYSFYGVRFKVD